MPKRPRYSANMRLPERALQIIDQPATAVDAVASEMEPTIETPSPVFIEQRESPPSLGRPDSLLGITGEAFMTMSLASSIGWTQGMALQLRLSSYMLGLNRRPAG